jgi:hypothetical protein
MINVDAKRNHAKPVQWRRIEHSAHDACSRSHENQPRDCDRNEGKIVSSVWNREPLIERRGENR